MMADSEEEASLLCLACGRMGLPHANVVQKRIDPAVHCVISFFRFHKLIDEGAKRTGVARLKLAGAWTIV